MVACPIAYISPELDQRDRAGQTSAALLATRIKVCSLDIRAASR